MSELLNPGVFQLSIVTGFFAWGTIYYMLASKAPADPSYRWIEILTCIHVFRYIGLIALVPAHFDAEPLGLGSAFQLQAGFGDWVAGASAMLTIVAVRRNWTFAIPIAWVFAIIAFVDNMNAAGQIAPLIQDQNGVGALGWLVITIYVPGLLLTAALLIVHLTKRALGKVPQAN